MFPLIFNFPGKICVRGEAFLKSALHTKQMGPLLLFIKLGGVGVFIVFISGISL